MTMNFDDQYLGFVRQAIQEQVPNAIYNQATQMNLVDTALNAVVLNAVSGFTNQILNGVVGHRANPLLAQVPGLLGLAQQLGLGQLLQQALNNTDLDEQLRDAVIEGFSRYLRDNAGHLAQLALQSITENAGRQR